MSEISLNIYSGENKNEVTKVHTVDGYDLMLGTIDDFMEIIDVDKLDDEMAIAKMIAKGYGQLKPLLKDIFPELTDEDYRHIKTNDLVFTIMQVGQAILESFKELKTGKNGARA